MRLCGGWEASTVKGQGKTVLVGPNGGLRASNAEPTRAVVLTQGARGAQLPADMGITATLGYCSGEPSLALGGVPNYSLELRSTESRKESL